jgi:Flp pilus assembly pilin Flp
MSALIGDRRIPPGDDRGAVATEYVIVATAIAIVVAIAASALAASVSPLFQQAIDLL